MSRDLPVDLATALATGGSVQGVLAFMCEFQFDSGTIGMWSGLGTLDYNDIEFFGGGNLVGVGPYEETQDLEAKGMVFTLSGVPLDTVSIAETENYQSRRMRFYLGLIDINSWVEKEDGTGYVLTEGGDRIRLEATVTAIYRLFSGLMDTMDIQDTEETATIQLSCENILSLLKRTNIRRWTPEDQKSRYPGDLGLDNIPALQDKDLIW